MLPAGFGSPNNSKTTLNRTFNRIYLPVVILYNIFFSPSSLNDGTSALPESGVDINVIPTMIFYKFSAYLSIAGLRKSLSKIPMR